MIILLEIIFHNRDPNRSNVNKDFHHHVKCLDQIFLRVEQGDCSIMLTKHVDFWSMWIKECMAEWLRRLTRKPKVRTDVGSNPTLDSWSLSVALARVDQSHVREIW